MAEQKKHSAAVYIRNASAEQIAGNKKTALYCRLAQASDLTIEMQERLLREYAEENGCVSLSSYIDNGASGLTLDRPAMSRLLSDIREGIIDTVVVKDISRIARGLSLLLQFFSEAQKYGVKVVTMVDGELTPIVTDLADDIVTKFAADYR
jgi:DNA invertase Pin-like site-specific DNA recombinase